MPTGVETLSASLIEARPTVLPCVPRLYEVLRQRITGGVERKGGSGARLFRLAVELGQQRYESGGPAAAASGPGRPRCSSGWCGDKVRARFGGRIKALVSGGAPLNYEVGLFFVALGLPVFQGYGQTEAAPVVSVNMPAAQARYVGPPFTGWRSSSRPTARSWSAASSVMQGYWRDQEATAAALRDGWLHTGDIGEIDADGYIRITDRKKDIIVNSGGDNIAPARVEGVLLVEPEIGQVLVYGDRRPHLVALIVPQPEFAKRLCSCARLRTRTSPRSRPRATSRRRSGRRWRAPTAALGASSACAIHVMPEPFCIENWHDDAHHEAQAPGHLPDPPRAVREPVRGAPLMGAVAAARPGRQTAGRARRPGGSSGSLETCRRSPTDLIWLDEKRVGTRP